MKSPSPTVDLSDLPANASANLRSFVSMVREGYCTKQGSWNHWKLAAGTIAQYSPAMYFLLCVAAGAIMRPLVPQLPGGIVHLKGLSTTGKSIALQTALSLRADPSDMTWCFDSMSTVKWYTIAAENNYLCLDDVHMAILPDNGACKPMSASFFQMFDLPDAPHCTIMSTSVPSIYTLAEGELKSVVELDARVHPFWPHHEHLSAWWMDHWVQELRQHYGHARERILDSLSQKTELWLEWFEHDFESLPKDMPPGKRSVLVQALLGRRWLTQNAKIEIQDFEVFDFFVRNYKKCS